MEQNTKTTMDDVSNEMGEISLLDELKSFLDAEYVKNVEMILLKKLVCKLCNSRRFQLNFEN